MQNRIAFVISGFLASIGKFTYDLDSNFKWIPYSILLHEIYDEKLLLLVNKILLVNEQTIFIVKEFEPC
jgi:hypothetical protein